MSVGRSQVKSPLPSLSHASSGAGFESWSPPIHSFPTPMIARHRLRRVRAKRAFLHSAYTAHTPLLHARLPVDEDVAAAEACAVDEVVAQREVLLEVLIGGVRRHDA